MPHPFVPNRMHIRNVILFLFLSGLKSPDIQKKITDVHQAHAPTAPTIRLWIQRFEANDFNLDDQTRSGRPVELDLDELQKNVEADPYQSSREIASTMGVSQSTTIRGLKSIGKVKKLGRFVPHDLKDFDKKRRVDMSMFLLSSHRTKAWLDDLITGDENWVHYSNNVRKAQWVDEDEQAAAVPKPEIHVKKVMLSIWWSVRGVEYWELLDEGKTITADVYSSQLQKLRQAVASSRGEKARVFFQHDNARPHVSKVTNAKLMSFGWTVLPHPPYSPDLTPSDYWLFSHLQHQLEGQNFKTKDDIKKELTSYFAERPAEFWQEGIKKLPGRWQQVLDADGEYFD
ncbi:hypothetical protein CRE_18120 [Caenorhabditis remanei]|uniref:Mos1 transposase HTH domain-containing protein n=1 Tax=Caenorhabditis remanei TaxID=31234 RepID=E3N364_CAERE|nr:hypothetical protein CRE_18120 [Caenorhabditis remanei]